MSETVWASAQLGQIASVITKGTTPTTYGHHYVPDGVLFLRVENITSGGRIDLNQVLHIDKRTHAFLARSQLVAGDLLVSIAGSIGRSAVVGEDHVPANCNQAIALIRLDESKAIASFVRSFLASARGQRALLNDAVQLAQANLSLNQIAKTCILLPPIATQHSITTVLDTIDEAIAKTEAVIAKLKQVRAGLLHDLLTRGLDENGQPRDPIAHPEQFQDSPLGKIPREWELKPCQNLCREIVVGIVVKPAQYYIKEGVPVLRSANVREKEIILADLVFISPESNSFLNKSILRPNDLVTVRTVYPGTTCVIPPHLDGANCVDLIISRPNSEIVPEFLALWINSLFGRDQVLRVQGGLAQQHFNVGELKTLLVAKPNRDEQVKIVCRIEEVDRCIQNDIDFSAKLRLIKNGLMTDLLTGRVRVPEFAMKSYETKAIEY